jgi:hypothetical protein
MRHPFIQSSPLAAFSSPLAARRAMRHSPEKPAPRGFDVRRIFASGWFLIAFGGALRAMRHSIEGTAGGACLFIGSDVPKEYCAMLPRAAR